MSWSADDLGPCRGQTVKVYARRVGTRGEYEGFALSPFASGTFIHKTGRVSGFGSKSIALHRVKTWCEQNGMTPVETTY